MKVEVVREKLLSNFEVYEHLNQIQEDNNWKKNTDSRKLKKSFNPNLEIIVRDVLSYLSKSVTSQQSVETFTDCMKELAKFPLEKIERLQIMNSTPYSLVHLYSVVEECDQRFNEEECQEILDIVAAYFPQQIQEDEEGQDEEQEVAAEVDQDQDVHMDEN